MLFAMMLLVWRLTDGRRRPGLLTGTFACGYALARIVGELFREPDAHLGYLWGPVTMGMVLSLPVLPLFPALLWMWHLHLFRLVVDWWVKFLALKQKKFWPVAAAKLLMKI